MLKRLANWFIKEIEIWKWLFTRIPTEEELKQRHRETAEKLGFVFFDEKKRDEFVKKIMAHDFLEGLPEEENKS